MKARDNFGTNQDVRDPVKIRTVSHEQGLDALAIRVGFGGIGRRPVPPQPKNGPENQQHGEAENRDFAGAGF